ncbi:MYND Zn-finger protein [Ceratobasidium sp. AG-Ba]|nr:MYND Zn-finger protein [Ceratobasidium sp. AG-Ba]QRW09262.1 MYND Zn-finger protein [Ceratobasidium sp. AG-Ba]
MHVACDIILKQTGKLDDLLEEVLPQTGAWARFSLVMAQAALDRAAHASPSSESDRDYVDSMMELDPDDYFINFDAFSIVRIIWEDRDSFLTLCARGLLPGASLLLMIAMTRLSMIPDVKEFPDHLRRIQDLSLRVYLVGSHRDRQILLPVCMTALSRRMAALNQPEDPVNAQDCKAIIQAYGGLVTVWKHQPLSNRTIPPSHAVRLAIFVMGMVVHEWIPVQMRFDVVVSLTQNLWLLFEHRGRIRVEHQNSVTVFAVVILRIILLGYFG